MDAADVAWLQTPEGTEAADEATHLLATATELSALRRLSRRVTSQQARAAVSLALGRRTAAGKFEDAPRLFCDRGAAEQASQEPVARYLARRFAGYRRVADLGCGMGGDALALAQYAEVLAIDRDPARLAMMEANARVRGLGGRISTLGADLAHWEPPPDVEAIWADPARRDQRGRRLGPEAWSPPLSRLLDITRTVRAAGIKLAPGIDLTLVPTDGEVEFISVDRELKAAVLWTGRLARAARTATVLPAVVSMSGAPDEGSAHLRPPGRYLYDPDPAVGRAGLIGTLARQLEAWKLDERIAYVTSDEAVVTPFARRFLVHTWMPFAERRLLEALRERGVGRVEVTRRGSPVDTNALEQRLNAGLRTEEALSGALVATVVLTRYCGRHIALICERESSS
jgi:SAM-dependent methyltransferase